MIETTELTHEYVKTLLPKRVADSNKSTYGNVLNIAGSINYRGAAYLSSVAALTVGAGYVTLAAIDAVIKDVSAKVSEVVFCPLKEKNGCVDDAEVNKILEIASKNKVISIGCGLGAFLEKSYLPEDFLISFLGKMLNSQIPIVIDADGLNILAKHSEFELPDRTILTPHPMELSRLLNTDVALIQENRVHYAIKAAEKFDATIVLKGSQTIITNGVETFINTTGNSALAKAGTGDVLTGMIAGFLAQGATRLNSACLAVYLHGLAADLAVKDCTEYSLLASDLIKYVPTAIKELLKEIVN